MRGAGRVGLAAVLLYIVGLLNVIYGIAALDDANVLVNDSRLVFTDLATMGWVLIVVGVIQLTGGFSLMLGHTWGKLVGILAGSLGAISALLAVGGAYPWWSLGIFFLSIYIVHGIFIYGEDERPLGT
jgi:hypothetical protein